MTITTPVRDLLPAATSMGAVTLLVADLDAMTTYYRDAVRLTVLPGPSGQVTLGRGLTPIVVLEHSPELRHAASRQAGLIQLADLLPPMTYQANPVDTGRPGPRHHDVIAVTAADPQIDVVAVYSLIEPVVDLVEAATTVRRRDGRVVLVGMDGPAADLEIARGRAEVAGLPLVVGPRALATAAREGSGKRPHDPSCTTLTPTAG